jgi:hypothetical protein
MLSNLPPELINIIVGYLEPPSEAPRTLIHHPQKDCSCFPQNDQDRELILYNTDLQQIREAYETDILRLGLAHPYVARCISDGGWHGVVDSLLMCSRRGGDDFGTIPCVPEEFRNMVR